MSSDSSRETAVADVPGAGDQEYAEDAENTEDTIDGGPDGGIDDSVDFAGDGDTDTVEPSGNADDAVDGVVAEDSVAATDAGGTQGHEPTRKRMLLPKRLVLGSAALALASFLVAAVFGVLWFVTASGDRAELASARSSVIQSAQRAVQAVTELDYQHPDRYFEDSKAVSTEQFAKSLVTTEKRLRQALKKLKTVVETSVLDIGVQELNNHKGTATFLAVIKTHTTAQGKGDTRVENTKVMRLKGKMERVRRNGDKEWKLSGLTTVPVVTSPALGKQSDQGSGSGKNQDTSKTESTDSSKNSGE